MRSVNIGSALLLLSSLLLSAQNKQVTCASCHTQAKTQPATAMAHAIEPVGVNPVLQDKGKLELQRGAYHYTLTSKDYTVSDGNTSETLPLQWPFGHNSQTYVFEKSGQFFEGLVSYYPGAGGLDTTIGDNQLQPKTLSEAMGRQLDSHEARSCFGCHATGAVQGRELTLPNMTPGVTCARCHVGTDEHFEAIKHGSLAHVPPRLKQMSAEDTSSFCGQCHRTWQTVVQNRWMGVINVRFQPYRLAKSKCFDGVDSRISCLGCHNPHEELVRDDKSYDSKCLACHSSVAEPSAGMLALHPNEPVSSVKMKQCPVATANCVSCHMPKVDLPGAHRTFTDHDIRIAKAGEPYPD